MADLKVLIPQQTHEDKLWQLEFTPKGGVVSTYAFDCDAEGNLYLSDLCEAGIKNLTKLIDSDEYESEVKEYTRVYTEQEIVECECGKVFQKPHGYRSTLNCPKCGKLYNLFGQELLHA